MTKKTIAFALVAFTVIAIASLAPPIAAQTASPELMQVKPEWKHLDLSENPWQILYAKIKNKDAEPFWVKVEFVVTSDVAVDEYVTEEAFLPVHPPKPLLLSVEFPVTDPGEYRVMGVLYYREEGAEWTMDGIIRSIKPLFIAT